MKKSLEIIKTTLKGGLLFIVPVFTLVYILGKVFIGLKKLFDPLTSNWQHKTLLGMDVPWIMVIIGLLLICFLAGLISKTRPAKRILDWIEESVLGNLPGYTFMKKTGENMLGVENEKSYQVILVLIEEARQIGFLIERIDENHVSVYIPGAPSPWSGSLYIMTNDRIAPSDLKYQEALNLVKNMGAGSGKLLAGKIPG